MTRMTRMTSEDDKDDRSSVTSHELLVSDCKEMFLEMSPACCLHKVDDLFRAARIGDYRYDSY